MANRYEFNNILFNIVVNETKLALKLTVLPPMEAKGSTRKC
jgi:hypothetical protein